MRKLIDNAVRHLYRFSFIRQRAGHIVTNKDELLSQLRINRDHPSDTSSSKARLWIGITAAVAAVVVVISLLGDPAPIKVQVEMARMAVPDSSAATVLDATGYVVARRTATVSSKVTGKVAEIYIEEGQQVEKDQVVALLDDSNTRKSWELSKAELHSAKTYVAETQARLTEAKLNLERNTEMARRQLVSVAVLDKARADFESLSAQLKSRQWPPGARDLGRSQLW